MAYAIKSTHVLIISFIFLGSMAQAETCLAPPDPSFRVIQMRPVSMQTSFGVTLRPTLAKSKTTSAVWKANVHELSRKHRKLAKNMGVLFSLFSNRE